MSAGAYVAVAEWSQVAASLLFIAFLVYGWRRFLTPAIVRSQARKNDELAQAERRRDETKAEIEVAQREVERAEGEARTIVARGEADAARVHDRIVAEARLEGERVIRNAEGELERGRRAARERVRADLLEQALQIARGAAGDLDDATDRRLVGEAIATADRRAP